MLLFKKEKNILRYRRKPGQKVVVHSDQGSQYTSEDWRVFLATHNLEPSMSRRGNCYDNAVAESFFQLLKRERIKRRIYKSREDARSDSLITSKCSTIRYVGTGMLVTCLPSNSKSSILDSL